ncbi:MAG: acylphosphatase [Chloroflexi bacterium]|nr:acylphosphatase [Chloroflexota bacterium]
MTQELAKICRFQAFVQGRVQGVGFRQYTRERAETLGLSGYVRNQWDRTVEVVAEGPEPEIKAFLAWLNEGPPLARVSQVNVHWLAPTGEYTGFEVAY